MNMEVVIASSTVLWMSKRVANCSEAGAIIEEETGLMKVKADTMAVAPHFFLKPQLHACADGETNTKGRCQNILSRIFWVIWTIPINGEDLIITGTILRYEMILIYRGWRSKAAGLIMNVTGVLRYNLFCQRHMREMSVDLQQSKHTILYVRGIGSGVEVILAHGIVAG